MKKELKKYGQKLRGRYEKIIEKEFYPPKSVMATLGWFCGAIALGFFILIGSYLGESGKNNLVLSEDIENNPEKDFILKEEVNPFENLDLQANSVYVWDVSNKKTLYAKNAYEKWPLASVTKIMSAITAADYISLQTMVPITEQALLTEGDSGLKKDDVWSLGKLLDLGLISSSNDAMSAVASITGSTIEGRQLEFGKGVDTFVDTMNRKAKAIGLRDAYFSNPHGLDTNEYVSGAYGTAQDVAYMLDYAIKSYPEILEVTKKEYIITSSLSSDELLEAINTNIVLSKIPGLMASKTGFTDLAGGNLVVVFDVDLNRPIVAVVLGSSWDGRFSDMLKLISATRESIRVEDSSVLADSNKNTPAYDQ